MKKFLFIGEKPSQTAYDKGYTWEQKRLAGKTLFDALDKLKIEESRTKFINIFGSNPSNAENNVQLIGRQLKKIKEHRNYVLVGMGLKVQTILDSHNIKHLKITHPAARGKIRKKGRYSKHVKEILQKYI